MATVIKLFFLFFVLGTISVQANGVWVTNPSFGNATGIVSSSDGTILYVSNNSYGSTGPIIESTNEGKTWSPLTGAGTHAWDAIASSGNGTKLWTVTCGSGCTDNNVYYSMDSGTTWFSATNPGFNTNTPSLNNVNVPCPTNNCSGYPNYMFWQNVASSTDGNSVLVSTQATTYLVSINQATTPPTATWSTAFSGEGTLSISADNSIFAGTDYPGNLHISTNLGKSWSTPKACGHALSVAAANNGIIYVGCGFDYIYKSTDSGVTWGKLTNAGMDVWQNMAVSADGLHILARGGNVLYYSDDGGNTWIQSVAGDDGFAVYASDGSKAYYTDGGALAYLPIPTISTSNATAISATEATLNATYIADDDSSASVLSNYPTTSEGFNYGTTTTYGLKASTTGSFSPGSFSQNVTGLTCGTTYYFQPYATNANGTNYGNGSYFTTMPCNGADFITSRSSIPPSASSTINLTGINTAWTSSSTFSVSGIAGDVISSQTVTDATHATITVSTNATTGALNVSDGSTISPISVSSSATTIVPATASQIWYSPGNSYNSGTYIQWIHLANAAKFNFTGSLLNVDLDLTPLVIGSGPSSKFPYLDWQIDNGPWQRALITLGTNATQVMALATGLSEGPHTAAIYFEPAGGISTWIPYNAINITGWEVQAGNSITAPSPEANIPFTTAGASTGLRPKTMMIFGDSITTGYDAEAAPLNPTSDIPSVGNTFVQDGWAPRLAKYLDAEAGIVAFSHQGWRVFGLNSTVPAFPNTFSMYDSTHPRIFPQNLDYLVVAQATNDYYANVTPYVTAWLSQARAAVGPDTYIFVIPNFSLIDYGYFNNGAWTVTNQIYAGVAAYKAANPSDTRVSILNVSGWSSTEQVAYPSSGDPEFGILGTTGSANNGDVPNFHDIVHPNKCGHALITMNLAGDLPAECTATIEAASEADTSIPSLVAQAIVDVPTQISNIAVSTTATTATITWTTDRSATSVVNYGTSSTYGSTSSNPNLVLSHSVTLTGLTQGQTYHYQILSVDTASATISAADATFTPSSTGVIYGDVNDAANGVVNIYDAELTAQYAIGLPVTIDTTAAAVDGTGKVNIYDAFLIAEYAVNLITTFPVNS